MRFIEEYLARAEQLHLHRKTSTYEPIDATHVKYDGQTYLVLASNNYLGLTHCRAVQQAAAAAAMTYGTGSGGARLITGTHPLYPLLEKELADFKETETALVFNTGYMANLGTISALAAPGDTIFSDELNHASIIDGCRLAKASIAVYRHADTQHLAELLRSADCRGKRLIVTDGVFSMDGDIAPLPSIVRLAEHYRAWVIVDDAHATGVIGPGGKGTAAYYGLEKKIHVQLGTLSKALGAEGGFAAGSRTLIDYLVNRARSFIFSTALSASTIAAARASLNELVQRPALVEKLKANSSFLRKRLTSAGLKIAPAETPIIPVPVGPAALTLELAQMLKNAGLIISAIRPPTVPEGTCRLRIAVSAAHTVPELSEAADKISWAARRLSIIK